MPIDKITPYSLNTSNDERLVKATEMTDALNVTISSDDEGNGFIIKNAKGNVIINPLTAGDALDNTTKNVVIGSVADLDTEFIYFFVWSSNNLNNAIYRVSIGQDNNYYQKVFGSTNVFDLNFSEDSYVDAALTRIDVNQDGSINTVIYFTDNINEPRKINVDRALTHDFNSYTADDYEEFISVCKTSPKGIIDTSFNNNSNIETNSLYGKSYSFAYQYVYIDGEVSAMSNFSSPNVCPYTLDGAKDDGKPIHDEHNQIKIILNAGNREVSYVNVYFRDNYTNTLFKIGRFSSTESSDKGSLGDNWVYNNTPATHALYFTGNGTYTPVSQREALRDFDNVPLKAKSVSISNNRLFFGNYTDGYPYTPVSATLSVSYDAIPPLTATISQLDDHRSWKAGVTHNFGIVFYDKKGRSGPVNDIGSVYVETLAERSAASAGLGRAKIQVAIDNGEVAPSWAEKYSIVYGGNNDISEFKQYSVADGFANFYRDTDYTDIHNSAFYHSEGNDNIYVSLKSWSESAISYVETTEADYNYRYKKGDVFKVLRYTQSFTGTTPSYAYPNNLKAKVIDKLLLIADMESANVEEIKAEIESLEDNSIIQNFGDIIEAYVDIVDGEFKTKEERIEALKKELEDARRDARYPKGMRNPICNGNYSPCKGHFLQIENINVTDWDSTDNEGHIGVDGNEVSTGHDTQTHFHPIPNWRRNVLAEISSPKRFSHKKVYKELNIFQNTLNFDQGSFLLTDGDVFLKKTRVIFSTPIDTDADSTLDDFDSRNLRSYVFEDNYLESENASHFFYSKASDHGHVKMVNEDAETVSRTASITYSDFQANDSNVLKFSSFYLSDANYKDMPYRYGQIDRLIDEDGYIFVLQDSKVSKIPVNKQVISTADGKALLTVSTNILGEPVFYGGDYGSSGYPQAVVYRDGRIFFFDFTSEKILRTGGDGLTIISDFGLDSFLESKISDFKKSVFEDKQFTIAPRIVGGYDPDYDEYLITFGDSRYHSLRIGIDENDVNNYVSVDGFTAAFNSKTKTWTSFYSFIPTCYSNIGDSLITCNSDTDGNLFFVHSDQPQYSNGTTGQTPQKSTYYGVLYDSIVEVVSSYNPSMVKVFNTLSLETDSDRWSADLSTSDQQTEISSFDVRERGRYAVIPRDTNSNVFIHLGKLASDVTSGSTITLTSKVSGMSIPISSEVYIGGTTTGDNTNQTISSVLNSKQISLSGNVTETANSEVYIKLDSAQFGDPLRDYFCKIRLKNQSVDSFELFAINTHYERSMLGQEKGQQ